MILINYQEEGCGWFLPHMFLNKSIWASLLIRKSIKMATAWTGPEEITQHSLDDSSDDSNKKSDSRDDSRQQVDHLWMRPDIKQRVQAKLSERSFGGMPYVDLSCNAQKKLLQIHMKKEMKKIKQHQKPIEQSDRTGEEDKDRLSKKDQKRLQRERAKQALKTGLKVAIDCSMQEQMSPKELSRLARHIQFAYSSNLRAEQPFHLYLTGLKKDSKLYETCNQQCSGFSNYLLDVIETDHHEYFKMESLVYLTPDSPNALVDLDPTNVYMIGGLVDESIDWGLTFEKASKIGLNTARLPVDIYMEKTNPSSNCVLPLNQVIDILLDIHSGKSWIDTLPVHLAQRKGFILKSEFIEKNSL